MSPRTAEVKRGSKGVPVFKTLHPLVEEIQQEVAVLMHHLLVPMQNVKCSAERELWKAALRTS